jgi:hypothetical protein
METIKGLLLLPKSSPQELKATAALSASLSRLSLEHPLARGSRSTRNATLSITLACKLQDISTCKQCSLVELVLKATSLGVRLLGCNLSNPS